MDLESRIAEMEADLSSWSLNQTLQMHRGADANIQRSVSGGSEGSESVTSFKPTGAGFRSDSSSGSVTPRRQDEEDAMNWELEEDDDEAAREAAELVQGLMPMEGFADRQRCAHRMATALGRSAEFATELTVHLGNTTVMRSLLRLFDDAMHRQDLLTADIVLACLTNLSGEATGRGVSVVMQEAEAVAGLLLRGLDASTAQASTAHYVTALLNNLKLQPAVVEALDVAQASTP